MAETGSRSYGGKRKHGLAWVPWVALLLLALIALLAFLLIRNTGDSGDAPGIDTTNEASATAGDQDGGVDAVGSEESGSSRTTMQSSTNAASSAALVGGGGVKVSPAQGDTSMVQGTVLFAEDSAELDAPARQVIASAATLLKSMNATGANVVGYTDVVGGTPVNSTLSQQRATAVADELKTALGSGVQVDAIARGEANPVAPNQNADGSDNPDNRQQNRRAVIAIVP